MHVIGEMQAFYRRFFHVTIDAAQAREILDAASDRAALALTPALAM
ncbi:MAG: hypothetical protein QM736_26570 [Vicinamibacterales bacterium]